MDTQERDNLSPGQQPASGPADDGTVAPGAVPEEQGEDALAPEPYEAAPVADSPAEGAFVSASEVVAPTIEEPAAVVAAAVPMEVPAQSEVPATAAYPAPPAAPPAAPGQTAGAMPYQAQPAVPPAAPPPPAPTATAAGRPHGSHAGIVVLAVVLALLFGTVAGAGAGYVAWRMLPQDGGSSQEITLVGDETEEVAAAAAAVALPSIVNIEVTGSATSQGDVPSGHPDAVVQSEGSGVAYKEAPEGGTYIITNNHVVEGAEEIVVTDSTGEQYAGELVGGDSESDVAVVRIDAEIPTIELGDSEELVVGQLAIAIGSPFGLEGTVTSGIVSALHRPLTDGGGGGQYPLIDSIQTDAAINPGNSGGALIDREGLLIGIPSAILTETGTSEGVGLAIPVNTAVNAADQLIDKGSVDTPFLGILGQTVDEQLVKDESLPVDQGAYVAEVTPDTEAAKAGLQTGDVIIALDDVRIRTMDDLVLAVRRRAVGDTVTLTLWRDGEKIEVEMKVGVKPSDAGTG